MTRGGDDGSYNSNHHHDESEKKSSNVLTMPQGTGTQILKGETRPGESRARAEAGARESQTKLDE